MKLIFDDRALGDLEGIYHWIAQDSPRAAKAVVERIFASAELLASFPYMGRAGREEGTREWVVPRLPHIVVYEVHEKRGEVVVFAVFHGAQDWETRLKEGRDPTG
jgi:plasmid stabilization system protein ParE